MLELEVEPVQVQVAFFQLLFADHYLADFVGVGGYPGGEEVCAFPGVGDGLFVGVGYIGGPHYGKVLPVGYIVARCLRGGIVVGPPGVLDAPVGDREAHGSDAHVGRVGVGARGLNHVEDGGVGPLEGLRGKAQSFEFAGFGVEPGVAAQGVGLLPAGSGVGEELTLVGEGIVSPNTEDDLKGLVEEGAVLFVSAVGFFPELDGGTIVNASGHSEIYPASRELVQEGDVLGDADGVPVGKDGAALADAQPITFVDQVGPQKDGVGGGAVPAIPVEVVLGEPDAGEAALVHEADLFPHLINEGIPIVILADVVVRSGVEPHT